MVPDPVRRRALITLAAATVTVIGALLLIEGEERHFLRHTVPMALGVGVVVALVTWTAIEDGHH